ncbi:MAG TPA: aldo/keto reductase [Steroidobacteraceae bacterium]|jgi:D-threo-aldose 1-dehydrogenase|nr:aldo/keto reductase [Steroidobacteraceae bacterium]
MRRVLLEGTDLSTTRLGLGTAALHHLPRRRARLALLEAAFEAGIRHFDTAPYYGHGIGEAALGELARTRRASLTIATKFGLMQSPLLARRPFLLYAQLASRSAARRILGRAAGGGPRRDYGTNEARTSLERSLRALRTDYVDILFVHEPVLAALGDGDALGEVLSRMRSEGKLRYVGLAGSVRDCIAVARRWPHLAQVLQVDASRAPEEWPLLDAAALAGQVSFGHFRGRSAAIPSLLGEAVRYNPSGVLLYSTRRPERIGGLARLLADR